MGAAAVAVAALAGTIAPAPAASGIADACHLLNPSDIHRVFGGVVDAGSPTTAPDGSEVICEWVIHTTSHGKEVGYGLELNVHLHRSRADFVEQRKVAEGHTATVRHVGDAAFSERAVVAGQVFDDLWVRHGSVQFRLSVIKDVGPKPLKRLAAVVLSALAAAPAPSSS